VEIQESIASGGSSLKLRIGVNLGEVIVGADGDLFGDGINIAVRLEGTPSLIPPKGAGAFCCPAYLSVRTRPYPVKEWRD
jgi:Adenylate and Guanylate cyclase catalytic domain